MVEESGTLESQLEATKVKTTVAKGSPLPSAGGDRKKSTSF